LRENIRHKHSDKWQNSRAQQRDNAPAHVLLIVHPFWASTKTTVIPHPAYSPDLTPCDFFPVPEDEIETQGAKF
jgi:histone-lysine N-methyltransferase SETMAR